MEIWRRFAPLFRVLQTFVFLVASSQMLGPHRFGHLERPYWLVEPLLEAGISSQTFWKAFSGLLLGASLLILMDSRNRIAQPVLKRTAGGVALAILFICGLSFALPQPSSRPLPEPTPPHAPDSPPPPPPPEKLAVVRFDGFCSPTDYTDNCYLFYKNTATDLRVVQEALAEYGPSPRWVTPVKTQISLFSKGAAVPNLIGGAEVVAVDHFDTSRFQAAFEIQARFPRDAQGAPSWIEMPSDRPLTKLEETLWQGIFASPKIRTSKAAARIKEELEKAGKLSEKAVIPEEKWNLENFIFENTTGGALNFAQAAADLLRLAGLESRVISGFRYDPGKGSAFHFKEVILLTEAHSAYWVEWRTPETDWRPLVIHPETVIDDKAQPPPEEDLENLLAQEPPPQKANKPQSKPLGDQLDWRKTLWPLLLGFCILLFLAYGCELAWGIDPELTVFSWMILVLGGLGWRCERGVGWDTFAGRVGLIRPEMAAHFNEVRLAVENVQWQLNGERSSRMQLLLIFISFLIGLLRWPKNQPATVSKSKATL